MMLQPRINYKLDTSDYLALFSSFFKSEQEIAFLRNLYYDYDLLFFDKARNGLRFILENIGIPNARIGIQPLTCPTVLEAIYLANCKPVFIDISNNYVISADILEKKIDEIDVLIVTHTFGINAEALKLKELLKEKVLIEDCAHGFLTESSSGKVVGTDGDFSIFSYGFGKFPTAVSGGFICINKSKSDKYIRIYQNLVQTTAFISQVINVIKSLIFPILNTSLIYTIFTSKIKKNDNLKLSYILPSNKTIKINHYKPNKAILFNQLRQISQSILKQKKNGKLLLSSIEQNNQEFTLSDKIKNSNFFILPIQVKKPDVLMQICSENGIEIGKHFVKTRIVIDYFGYTAGECPNYEQLIKNLVTLPTHYKYPANKTKLLADILTNYKSE